MRDEHTVIMLPNLEHQTGHRRLKNILRGQLFGSSAPEKIDRFEIRRQLGAGGMGVVYAAYDSELDREIAIKLLRSSVSHKSNTEARLLREAQAMAKLSHPNVVPVYETGRHEGQVFLAMELIPGETLRNWQTRQERSWREKLAMYIQAGNGLSAAHVQGITHRDFKPDNVLVGRDGRARVVDFGLARIVDDIAVSSDASSKNTNVDQESTHAKPISNRERLTRTGTLMGTIAYMSPEQFSRQSVDTRTDQFSFCVALYEALYGQRPFRGHDAATVTKAVFRGDVRPAPSHIRIPGWLRDVLVRGLSVEPDERYASMNDLLTELGRDRRRRRRIVAASAILLLCGAGIGTAAGILSPESSSPCTVVGSSFGEIWNPDRAAALERAFIGTRAPYATTIWASANAALDRHADSWAQFRGDACRATFVEQTQSPELYDLQMACLDRQREGAAALIEQFSVADQQVVENAYSAVLSLPNVDECRSVELLRLGIKPPIGEHVAEQVHEIRSRLAHVAAMRTAGKLRDAQIAASVVVEDARVVTYPPVIAEALFELGRLRALMGAGDDAVDRLLEAVDIAEANRHDRLSAEIWTHLISVAAQTIKQSARGRNWFRRAKASISRVGGQERYQQSMLASAIRGLGLVHFLTNAYADAESEHRRALEIRTRLLGSEHLYVAESMNDLANVLAIREQWNEALAMYRRALSVQTQLLGDSHPDVSKTLYNIAWVSVRMRRYEHAREYYERALEGYRQAYGRESPRTADVMLAMAQLANAQGDIARTSAYVRDAIAIYEHTLPENHLNRAQALNIWATVLFHEQKYEDALENYRRALRIYQRADEAPERYVAMLESNLGETLVALGRPKPAIAHFQRAIALNTRILGTKHGDVAYISTHLARALLQLDRPDDARDALTHAASVYATMPMRAAELADVQRLLTVVNAKNNVRQ